MFYQRGPTSYNLTYVYAFKDVSDQIRNSEFKYVSQAITHVKKTWFGLGTKTYTQPAGYYVKDFFDGWEWHPVTKEKACFPNHTVQLWFIDDEYSPRAWTFGSELEKVQFLMLLREVQNKCKFNDK